MGELSVVSQSTLTEFLRGEQSLENLYTPVLLSMMFGHLCPSKELSALVLHVFTQMENQELPIFAALLLSSGRVYLCTFKGTVLIQANTNHPSDAFSVQSEKQAVPFTKDIAMT